MEWTGFQDGCLRRGRELFLHSATEKGPFQYLCSEGRSSAHVGVWSGKQGYPLGSKQETESNSEVQETSMKGQLTEVWAGLREQVQIMMHWKCQREAVPTLSAEGRKLLYRNNFPVLNLELGWRSHPVGWMQILREIQPQGGRNVKEMLELLSLTPYQPLPLVKLNWKLGAQVLQSVRASALGAQSREQGKNGFGRCVQMINGRGLGHKQRISSTTGLSLTGPGRLAGPKTPTRSTSVLGQDPESRAHCRHWEEDV